MSVLIITATSLAAGILICGGQSRTINEIGILQAKLSRSFVQGIDKIFNAAAYMLRDCNAAVVCACDELSF